MSVHLIVQATIVGILVGGVYALLASGQESVLRGGRSSGTDILSGGDEIVSSGFQAHMQRV